MSDRFSVVRQRSPRSARRAASRRGQHQSEGDSTWEHFDDTVYGGDFLANQPPAKAMCEMAPAIIYLFDRMGVPFSRTKEGLLDFRRFGGTKHHRTAFAGASTGQQLLYALDEQVRRYEVGGKVKKYEGWEMLSLVLDDHQVCRGLIAMNRHTLELKAFPADAVIMATGGPGLIFGKSTNSMVCTGSAVSACYQQAALCQREFIQVHPTIIGEDNFLDVGIGRRRRRARVVRARKMKTSPVAYPLEITASIFPKRISRVRNLVPRDIATPKSFKYFLTYGGGGKIGLSRPTPIDARRSPQHRRDSRNLEIFVVYDPRHVPMRISRASIFDGRILFGPNQRTNVPGLLAAGSATTRSKREPPRRELARSCVYGGFIAAPAALEYAQNVERNGADGPKIYDAELKLQQSFNDELLKQTGGENQHIIHDEMGKWMTDNVTVVRYNDRLKATDEKLLELIERYKRISISDSNMWATMALPHARQLWNMLQLARVITLGALQRDESRGAHYKPDFPNRDDERFLKTTIAEYSGEGPVLSYEDVDVSLSSR